MSRLPAAWCAGTGAPFYSVSAAACRWLHTFGITAAGTMPNAIDPAALEQEAAHAPDWRAKRTLATVRSCCLWAA